MGWDKSSPFKATPGWEHVGTSDGWDFSLGWNMVGTCWDLIPLMIKPPRCERPDFGSLLGNGQQNAYGYHIDLQRERKRVLLCQC